MVEEDLRLVQGPIAIVVDVDVVIDAVIQARRIAAALGSYGQNFFFQDSRIATGEALWVIQPSATRPH